MGHLGLMEIERYKKISRIPNTYNNNPYKQKQFYYILREDEKG